MSDYTEGKKAPDFHLLNQDSEMVSLADFKGKTVVLFFYPRANTPGCTVEASGFATAHDEFAKRKIVVLGVSPDTPAAQKKFQQKFNMPFSLLCDPDRVLAKEYDIYKPKVMYGKSVMGIVRTTIIIGPDGKIVKIFPKVKPDGHADQVLEALR